MNHTSATTTASSNHPHLQSISDRSKLGFILTLVLFLIALLLPALEAGTPNSAPGISMTGWRSAHVVGSYLFGFLEDSFDFKKDFVDWFYYSAFNVTNLALLGLPILSFTKRFGQFSSLLPWFVGACFLHAASWWFCEKQQILAGYYVWRLAVGVLFAACLARVRSLKTASKTAH